MRDLPPTRDLLDLARRVSVLDLPPSERERDAHLAATAEAIAAREAEAGEGWQREIEAAVAELYGAAPHPNPLPASGERVSDAERRTGEGQGQGRSADLLALLASDLRNGAFETTPSRETAARAILWRLVLAKLRETNPQFLAANGFE